jgi:hypothetical protein
MKFKLTEEQLMRANEVYFALGAAEMAVHRLKRDYERVVAELQNETGQNFNSWTPSTGDTDVELPFESTAVEVIPPRKKRKSTSL